MHVLHVQDLNEVIAITLVGVNHGKAFQAEQLAKMKELRYLLLDGCQVNGYF